MKQVEKDAVEFGVHVKQGGWRLGLLVARSVGDGKDKLTSAEFAQKSGTAKSTVELYLQAWDDAALDGIVPESELLVVGEELDGLDELQPWTDFYHGANVGVYHHATDTAEAYVREASNAGVTTGSVIRAGSSKKALAAAIKADPKVAEAAAKALVEVHEEKIASFAAKHGQKQPTVKPEIDAAYVDVGGGVLGEAITALDVEIEKMERADWVKALLRVSKALERNVKSGVKRFGYTSDPKEISSIKEIQAVLSETAFQFSDGFIAAGTDVHGEVK